MAFAKKNSKVALRRWFSWCDAFRDVDQSWHSWLLSFTMFGMKAGIYKDFTEVPLWKMEGERGLPKPSGSDTEEEDERRGDDVQRKAVDAVDKDVAPSDDKEAIKTANDLKEIRALTKGSIHCAATIFCRDMLQSLCRVIASVIEPIRLEHGNNASMCRDEAGTRAFYISAARGRVFQVLEASARRLMSPHHLQYMGFTTDFGSGLPHGLTESSDRIQEEDELAEHAMNVWRNCAKHRIASMTFHVASWIGLYALAASDDEMDWYLCLQKLRRHFRAFLNAKIHEHQSPFLKKVVDASPFNTVIMQDVADLATAPGIQRSTFIMKKFRSYALAIFSSWARRKWSRTIPNG